MGHTGYLAPIILLRLVIPKIGFLASGWQTRG